MIHIIKKSQMLETHSCLSDLIKSKCSKNLTLQQSILIINLYNQLFYLLYHFQISMKHFGSNHQYIFILVELIEIYSFYWSNLIKRILFQYEICYFIMIYIYYDTFSFIELTLSFLLLLLNYY